MDLADERVPFELKKTIQNARLAKKMTQAELAQVSGMLLHMLLHVCSNCNFEIQAEVLLQGINEKPQIIQEYESGKAIPNPQVLSKLSRILGVQLSAKGKKPK